METRCHRRSIGRLLVAVAIAAGAALLSPALAVSEYRLVGKWGAIGAGGDPAKPAGVPALDPAGERTYVSDYRNHRIHIHSAGGDHVSSFGSYGSHDGQFKTPDDLAIDRENNALFVADELNHRIQLFDLAGTFRAKWGTLGSGGRVGDHDAEFNWPAGIEVGERLAGDVPGRMVYVCDFLNHRLQKFSVTYSSPPVILLDSIWPMPLRCGGLAVDVARDRVYTTPAQFTQAARIGVAIHTLDGVPKETWGSFGEADGQFQMATAVDTDGDGNVYVTDHWAKRVQKLDAAGNLLAGWSTSGQGDDRLAGAWGLEVGPDGTAYVTDGGTQVKLFRNVEEPPAKPKAAVRIDAGLRKASSSERKARKKARKDAREKARERRTRPRGLSSARATPQAGDASELGAKVTVPYGQAGDLRGRVFGEDGRPLAGEPIDVEARLSVEGAGWSSIASATTDATGHYAVSVPSGPSRLVRVAYRGSDTHQAATSRELSLVSGGKITARIASPRVLRPGQWVVVVGRLHLGGITRIPPNLLLVRQRETRPFLGKSHWVTVPGDVRVYRGGSFRWSFRLRPQLTRRRLQLEVASRPDPATWPYLVARSKPMRFTVLPSALG